MTEQRRHARLPLTRRVKLRCPDTGRCYAGQTHDVAAGGLRLQLDSPASIAPGSRLQLAVDWSGKQAIIPADLMAPVTVVRRITPNLAAPGTTPASRPQFAVSYDRPQPLAATA